MHPLIFQLGFFLLLLVIGYLFGRMAERRHYRSIIRREAAFRRIPVFATRHLPDDLQSESRAILVMGSVVISVDYFKRFLAGLRMLVGGRMVAYESLIDRARREAVLRMQDQARIKGANSVFNIKFETASISKGAKGTVGSVEVLAYGSALILPKHPAEQASAIQKQSNSRGHQQQPDPPAERAVSATQRSHYRSDHSVLAIGAGGRLSGRQGTLRV